jgi:hypothetical protein
LSLEIEKAEENRNKDQKSRLAISKLLSFKIGQGDRIKK